MDWLLSFLPLPPGKENDFLWWCHGRTPGEIARAINKAAPRWQRARARRMAAARSAMAVWLTGDDSSAG